MIPAWLPKNDVKYLTLNSNPGPNADRVGHLSETKDDVSSQSGPYAGRLGGLAANLDIHK